MHAKKPTTDDGILLSKYLKISKKITDLEYKIQILNNLIINLRVKKIKLMNKMKNIDINRPNNNNEMHQKYT